MIKTLSYGESNRAIWKKPDCEQYIKAIDHTFYGFTGVITHFGCWAGEQSKRSARNLQAFRVFSQHPKWVITPVNPEKVLSIAFIKYF